MVSLSLGKLIARAAENWPAKVLSIALAIILSVFYRNSTLESRSFSVPLRVEHGTSLIPASSYPRMIRVNLRGEADSISPVLESDIEVYIDLQKYETEGRYRVPVQFRKGGTALGAGSLEITVDPMEISLELDHRESKSLLLKASIRGSVEEGYDLASQTLIPSHVTVEGPRRLLANITELSTDEVDLDGRNENFSVPVKILNRNSLLLIRGNGTAEFQGFIQRLVSKRNFEGSIPIMVMGLNPQFTAELDVTLGSVHVEGSRKEELDSFTPPVSFLSVDASAIEGEGIYTLPVLAAPLPPGLNMVGRDPEEVLLTVTLGGKTPDHRFGVFDFGAGPPGGGDL